MLSTISESRRWASAALESNRRRGRFRRSVRFAVIAALLGGWRCLAHRGAGCQYPAGRQGRAPIGLPPLEPRRVWPDTRLRQSRGGSMKSRLALLSALALAAATPGLAQPPAEAPAGRAEVLVLGAYHMANPA